MFEWCIDLLGDVDLNEAEQRVVDAAATGVRTDFRQADDVLGAGGEWGPERTVRAEMLVALLTTSPTGGGQFRALSMAGARITGQVDLEAMSLLRPLVLHDCWLEQPVILDEARAPRLDFSGCRLPALHARQLETRGDVTLDRVIETTELMLEGARIGGALRVRETQISQPGQRIINGDRLEVHVEMDCGGLQTDGEVRLVAAHIGGRLALAGARLANTPGPALNADGLRVDQDVFCETDAVGRRFEVDGELRLLGAHIAGQLSLEGARLANAQGRTLSADGLHVDQGVFFQTDTGGQRFEADGELRLLGAHIGGVLSLIGARLTNAHGSALTADGLEVDQDVFCQTDTGGQRFEADGELRLLGAHIGGVLSLIGARLTNAHGYALSADTLEVDQGVFCHTDTGGQRFEADGELRLLGAHIGGQLALLGARLTNAHGPALAADGLQVDQGVFCQTDTGGQRFEADGELRLVGAHVGGALSLIGAHLTNARGYALNAEGLQVDQGVFCQTDTGGQRCEVDGELRLLGARIGGHLNLLTLQLSNPARVALNFERGEARRLSLPRLRNVEVDLSHAVIRELYDDPRPASAGGQGYRARLAGLTYDSLGPDAADCDTRLAWIARAADGYVPQAYDQLASVMRRAGRDGDAKKVMIAKQVRRRGTLSLPGKAASLAFGVTLGYGYRTWRATAALVAVVLVGWHVFELAYPGHMAATRPKAQMPDFHALLYSLDAVLPVVNLGQESAWSPQGVAQAWYGFSILAGWLLGLGLVAFLTARFFRE